MYPEPIEPATADTPTEALWLVCEALSEGDLEAALALYEPEATLALFAGKSARRTEAVKAALGELMETRLPVRVAIMREIVTGDFALVFAVRAISGRSIDGTLVQLAGEGCAMLRRANHQSWQLVVDDWNLTRGNASSD
jgi:ketosteroid isomerase-like protein